MVCPLFTVIAWACSRDLSPLPHGLADTRGGNFVRSLLSDRPVRFLPDDVTCPFFGSQRTYEKGGQCVPMKISAALTVTPRVLSFSSRCWRGGVGHRAGTDPPGARGWGRVAFTPFCRLFLGRRSIAGPKVLICPFSRSCGDRYWGLSLVCLRRGQTDGGAGNRGQVGTHPFRRLISKDVAGFWFCPWSIPLHIFVQGAKEGELGRFRGLSLVAGLPMGRLESSSNGRDES
jgi:hypothetical protein